METLNKRVGIDLYRAAAIFQTVRSRFGFLDWKIGSILLATFLSVLITIIVYCAGFGHHPETFFGAIFASWVGGVAFFALVGSVVTVATLIRPEHESFETRARILFRGASGSHIDYIVPRIKELIEFYAESSENRVSIVDYDQIEKKYRLAVEGKTLQRSYLVDITSTYRHSVTYRDITLPPAGMADNKLVYLRIDNKSQPISGPNGGSLIDVPYTVEITPGTAREVSHRVEVWFDSESERFYHQSVRFSKKVSFFIENILQSRQDIVGQLSFDKGANWEDIKIPHGADILIRELHNVLPNTRTYDLRLPPPPYSAS